MGAARQVVLRLNKAATPVWSMIEGNAKPASFLIETAISAVRDACEPTADCGANVVRITGVSAGISNPRFSQTLTWGVYVM